MVIKFHFSVEGDSKLVGGGGGEGAAIALS